MHIKTYEMTDKRVHGSHISFLGKQTQFFFLKQTNKNFKIKAKEKLKRENYLY